MQNFLFRKNSHSASVVAKALPRPPESPPSPSPAPVRGSGSDEPPAAAPIARTAPPKTGVPQNSGERMHESRSAGTQTARGTGGTHPHKPVCPCAGGRNRRMRRYAEVRRTYGPTGPRKGFDGSPRNADRTHLPIVLQIGRPRTNVIGGVRKSAPSTAFVGRARPCSRSSAAPQRLRGRRLRIPPEAGGSDAVRQNRHSRTYVQTSYEDRTKNVRTNPDTPTGTPSRRIRHTHPIHGRLRTPGKPAQAATSPAQRASGTETTCRTQRNSSPTTSLSPTSSHAESALTAPRRTPSARSAATNRTTRSVPSAPQPLR